MRIVRFVLFLVSVLQPVQICAPGRCHWFSKKGITQRRKDAKDGRKLSHRWTQMDTDKTDEDGRTI
jgi:hypothetical protein